MTHALLTIWREQINELEVIESEVIENGYD